MIKRKIRISILILLFLTSTFLLVSQNIINAAADEGGDPPYMDWNKPPALPNDKCYWDFNNDTLVGWHIAGDIGNRDLLYNITSMRYLENSVWPGSHAYGVEIQEIYYDMVNKKINSYPDSLEHPIINASLTNFTDNGGMGYVYPTKPGLQTYIAANLFITKNDTVGKPLNIAWSANALRIHYCWMLSNYTYWNCDIKYYGNTIELYNSTEGTYANLTYDNQGILLYAKIKAYIGGPEDREFPKIINFTRIYNFQKNWDLNLGDKVGWNVDHDFGGQGDYDLIYNITRLGYFFNLTGEEIDDKDWHYGVSLTPMAWNVSKNALQIANISIHPIYNVSLTNVTKSELLPADMDAGSGLGLICNPFIFKNASGSLDIYWCAEAMRGFYSRFLMGGAQKYANVIVSGNSIYYSNETGDGYCNLTYDNNGILLRGEIRSDFQGQGVHLIKYTRIYDFNPLNNIRWTNKFDQVGESIIFYTNDTKVKYDFIKTNNSMEYKFEWDDGEQEWRDEFLYYQEVWANLSVDQGGTWQFQEMTVIGRANDYQPIVFGGDDDGGLPILLVPTYTTGYDLAEIWKPLVDYGHIDFNVLLNGSNWIYFNNSLSKDYEIIKYYADGLLQYLYTTNQSKSFMGQSSYPLLMYPENYPVNMTDLLQGPNSIISFIPSGTLNFNVTLNITISITGEITKLIYLGFTENPNQFPITDALFYFDLWFNTTNWIEYPINITIEYTGSINWQNLKMFYFNESSKGWEEIKIIINGNKIKISIDHASTFVLTGKQPTTAPIGDGDDDDDDDGGAAPAIPFGNYYLIFLLVGMIGIVLYTRRKLIFK